MMARVLKLIPRHLWLPVGALLILCGHIPLMWADTGSATVWLMPVVVTTVCLMFSRRHVYGLLAIALLASILFTAAGQNSLAGWRSVASVMVAEMIVAAARIANVRSRFGFRARVSGRLKRQAEQLRAARLTQVSSEKVVQQFESDRRALLEHLPVHVVQKDSHGCFTFVSRSFCELVKREYGDIIGKTDHDIFPDDAARKFVDDDRRVMLSGQVFSDVESTQLPDGSPGYMQVRKAPLLDADGQTIGVQGIFWDVTEEFSHRKELQRIEALAHALIHAALDAVLIVDADGRVLEGNPAAETILGYTSDQVASHPPLGSIMHTTVEEAAGRASDPPGSVARYQRKATIGEILKAATGRRIEARLRRSDEVWFEAEISAHPLDLEGDQNWALFIRDITRRKQAELELRRAKETAEHANAAKSEFVANVSHELRTPLTGIIGLHELLAASEIDARQRNYLELAKVSATNLLSLIDDLLDFSKIEAGHVEIEENPFSLTDCIEQAAVSMAARAQLRGLELTIDLDQPLEDNVVGDSYRIKQVLLNLLGNAIKFTEKGDIRVQVSSKRLAPEEATTQSPQPRALVRVEVHDTGIGVTPDQRKAIFEAFRQADASTTRRFGGTGLGLTICRDLIAKMNGCIGVEEARTPTGEVSQGSCFFFELPLPVTTANGSDTDVDTLGHSVDASGLPHPNYQVESVVLVAGPSLWSDLLERDISRHGFQVTRLNVEQLQQRRPTKLFAAGNNTLVVADFRELSLKVWDSPPVVRKWVLLTPLASSHPTTMPSWLAHANVNWLSRPVCRQALRQALLIDSTEAPALENVVGETTTPDIRSAELLLVEDSPISQTVLKDMLQSMGHRVRVVSDGRAAIRACQERRFDLVLMDIQMPDLDGFEATQAIRARESRPEARQIIYALTAHATASDRARCVEAGMDGFLVKPISLLQLREAVAEALTGGTLRSMSPPLGMDHHAMADESITHEVLDAEEMCDLQIMPDRSLSAEQALHDAPDWAALLKLMHGNAELLRDVLSLLVREAPKLARSFREALQSENLNEARRAVHTLKSNVRYVGLTQVGDYAQRLEHLAKDHQSDALQAHSDALTEVTHAIADWAQHQLASNPR